MQGEASLQAKKISVMKKEKKDKSRTVKRCQAQIMFGVKFTSCFTLALTHIYYKHHPYHYHLST